MSLNKLFNFFVVYNPSQSSPSLTILVPLLFIIISLVFLHILKHYFQVSFNLKVNLLMDKIPQNIVTEPLLKGVCSRHGDLFVKGCPGVGHFTV